MKTVFLTAAALLLTGLVIGQRENSREQDSIAATGRCVFINESDPFPNMIAFKINGEETEGTNVSYIYGKTSQIEKYVSAILSNFDKSLSTPDSTVFDGGMFFKYFTLNRTADDFSSLLILATDYHEDAIVTFNIYTKEEE